MSDDQIREYLRSRADGPPPPDLVDSISRAAAAAPQQGRSWFASLLPAAVAVGAMGAVLLVALLTSQAPPIGPAPSQTLASVAPSPSTTAATTPEASPSADEAGTLIVEGASVSFDPIDSNGSWGSGELIRGRDITRYAEYDAPGTYLLEIFVRYDAERVPEPAQFGSSDWSLRPTDPDVTYYFTVEPINGRDDPRSWPGPDPGLGQYPGAVDVLTTPTEGWIVFQVDARTLDSTLELVYSPAGVDAPARTFIVRTADSQEPVVGGTLPHQPGDPVYVERPGLPFTVLDSAQADELFETPDTCRNPEAGYTVAFPDDWYTNTPFGEQPACTSFTPDFFTVDAIGKPTPPVWISFQLVAGDYGYVGTTEGHYRDEVAVDGRDAVRFEYNSFPNSDPDHRSFDYVIRIRDGLEESGPTLVATVDSDLAGDYQLAKAVLDRIMASLAFDE